MLYLPASPKTTGLLLGTVRDGRDQKIIARIIGANGVPLHNLKPTGCNVSLGFHSYLGQDFNKIWYFISKVFQPTPTIAHRSNIN